MGAPTLVRLYTEVTAQPALPFERDETCIGYVRRVRHDEIADAVG